MNQVTNRRTLSKKLNPAPSIEKLRKLPRKKVNSAEYVGIHSILSNVANNKLIHSTFVASFSVVLFHSV